MTAWFVMWLAEGFVAFGATAVLTRAFQLNAATRYVAWWMSLTAIGAFTWVVRPRAGDVCAAADCGLQAATSEPLFYIDAAPDLFVSAFLGIWLSITLVRLLRVVPSLHAVYSLRDRCTSFPPAVEARLPLWLEARRSANARRRRTRLMVCDAVQSATVLGFQRPCIAVPPHLLESLTPAELDHVILHEYAHVRRHDDWTRLAQALMQASLWVHPAVQMIGRQMDREREMACDEWVVARTGQPKIYARCLARAAEVLVRARSLELTPALFGRVHDVVQRVDRLLSMRGAVQYQVSMVGAVVVAIAIATGIAAVRAVPLIEEIGEVTPPFAAVRRASALRPVDHEGTKTQVVTPAGARLVGHETIQRERRARMAARAPVTGVMYPAIETSAQIASAPILSAVGAETVPLESRAIAGAYSHDPVGLKTATERPSTWSRVGATAAQLGAGAGKAGVSLGGMFSRAGTSAARRF